MKIGIIGSGNMGSTLTRRFCLLGHDVVVANSRGPASLTELASETGAQPATVEEAVAAADVVVLAIPLRAVAELPPEIFTGKIVVDVNDYYPQRDGRIISIDRGEPSSQWVARHLAGAHVVKALNTIQARHLAEFGRPARSARRIALPIAGNHQDAKRVVATLIDALGFDTVDTGSLSDSWRQEPGTPIYTADEPLSTAHHALAEASPRYRL